MSGKSNPWAPLPLRLAFGGLLLYAGGRKLFLAKGHENIVHLLEELGMPAAEPMGWVVGLIEFGGGLSLFLGLWLKPVAAINVVNLLLNLVLGELRGGLPAPLPGQQALPNPMSSILGIAGLLTLLMTGPGAMSIDGRRAKRPGPAHRLMS
jgi:putative oxidoreductase